MNFHYITQPATVAVMGAGSWGTTMAKVFADSQCTVRLWARRPELAEQIQRTRHNDTYLSGITLPLNITATADATQALTGADIVVLAVPSQSLRANLKLWVDLLPKDAVLLSLAKGIEKDTLLRMSEVISEVTSFPNNQICVLSGPNLSREIAQEQPAATVIACEREETAWEVQHTLKANYFRAYTNRDVIGCEIGGACKNVIALATGMAVGSGLGENTAATLITRGLAEVTRLGRALGAEDATFAGLAGMGDLVATCASPLSRNRTFGARLGAGATVAQAQYESQGQVAEGVHSVRAVVALARQYGVDMPLSEAVYEVCHEDVSVQTIMGRLMQRAKRSEHYD